MPNFRITSPDGTTYNVTAPDGATPEQAMALVQSQHAAQPPGGLQSAAEGIGQGLSFGTSDEIEGAARAAYDKLTGSSKGFGDLYSEEVAKPRARQAAEAAAHPFAYHGGEIAGGVGSALAGGGVGLGIRGGATLAGRTLAGMGEGGIFGGLYGAGTANTDDVKGTLAGAGQGVVTGSVMGGATPAAVDLGSALLGPVARGIRGMTQPKQVANEKLAETIGRDFGASGNTGQLQTASSDLNARMAAAAGSGKPLVLADFMGDNGRKLLRSAVNMPNDKRNAFNQMLDQRQTGQWSRIENDLASGLGSPEDYKSSVDQIVAERAKNATPDFQAAYNQPWNVKASDPLPDLLQRPYMQRLLQKTSDKISGVTGEDPAALSPWEFLHRVRMQINKEITGLRSGQPDPVANWDAGDLQSLKGQLDTAIAKNNPEFGKAINNYAGDSALKEAANDGLDDALKLPTEDLAQKMRSFTNQSEADMYRMGAARAIAQKLRSGDRMNDRTKGAMNSPDMDKRLDALFPDQASRDAFTANLGLERDMYKTRAASQGGSTTAGQLTEQDEAGKPVRALSAIGNAMAGRFEPLLFGLSRVGNAVSGMTPATANATLDTMMTPVGRGGTMAMGNALREAMAHGAQIPANRAQLSNALIGAQGPLTGTLTQGAYPPGDPRWRNPY